MSKNNTLKHTQMYLYDHKLRMVGVFKGVQKIATLLHTTTEIVRRGIDSSTPILSSKREYFFIKTKPLEQNSVYVNLSEQQLLNYRYRINVLGFSNFFEV